MIRRAHPALWLTVWLMSCGTEPVKATDSNGGGPMGTQQRLDGGPSDVPPPPPPPPAQCGDMNGGGDQHVDFPALMKMKVAEKDAVMARQLALLEMRYDLADRPSPDVTMSRGKPVQQGIRAKLPAGQTWEALAGMTPEQIRAADLFPPGFFPLPHPKQAEGGMLFPHFHIEEVLRQTGRNLARFDLDFDLPDPFLPEFPPAIFLTTRPDLGDVSQGQVVTTDNFFELFKCILNPKQLDGLRLLLTAFPQQQFNFTDDRRAERPSQGVAFSIVTSMATPTPEPTSLATFDRRRRGIASIRRRCAERRSSSFSARSAAS